MKGRAGGGSLRQFHTLPPEDVIQAQLSGDLLRNVQTMSSSSIDIDFLKNDNVRIRIAQEFYDGAKLEPPVNIPIDYSYGTSRPGQPLAWRKILGKDLFC
jgi:hypothetical protein